MIIDKRNIDLNLYPMESEEIVHSFEVKDAKLYGVECAVILYNIKFWLRKNLANGKNIEKKDNISYVWTFNSVKAWHKLFPYLTERQIKERLAKLEKDGAVITGIYNKYKYDRTKWYTTYGFALIDETDLSNGRDRNVQPIPDINTDTKLSITEDKNTTVATAPVPPKKKEETTLCYDSKDYLKEMTKNTDKRIKIIAWYINKKEIDISSKKKVETVIKRNLKISGELLAYSGIEVARAFQKCVNSSKGDYEITLETILKKLTSSKV